MKNFHFTSFHLNDERETGTNVLIGSLVCTVTKPEQKRLCVFSLHFFSLSYLPVNITCAHRVLFEGCYCDVGPAPCLVVLF